MNFLQRIIYKQKPTAEKNSMLQKVMVCYEANISFDTSFLVHFYDAANMPFLLEKKGIYFYYQDYIPFQRSAAYFRVHVFNPLCLLDQTVRVTIKVENTVAVEKTFAVSGRNSVADWHSVTANLISL